MSMSNATRYGFKGSLKFNLGVFAGFVIIIALCTVFSAGLYELVPSVKPVMTFVGAAYILWLAWRILRGSPNGHEDIKATNSFKLGLLLQFVNVKVILYGITAVSTFILPYYDSPVVLFMFTIFLAFCSFASTCCWAVFGATFQKFLSRHSRLVNTVMSLLLVYCAVSLFL